MRIVTLTVAILQRGQLRLAGLQVLPKVTDAESGFNSGLAPEEGRPGPPLREEGGEATRPSGGNWTGRGCQSRSSGRAGARSGRTGAKAARVAGGGEGRPSARGGENKACGAGAHSPPRAGPQARASSTAAMAVGDGAGAGLLGDLRLRARGFRTAGGGARRASSRAPPPFLEAKPRPPVCAKSPGSKCVPPFVKLFDGRPLS